MRAYLVAGLTGRILGIEIIIGQRMQEIISPPIPWMMLAGTLAIAPGP